MIDDEPLLSLEQTLELATQGSDALVSAVLARVEIQCIAAGFSRPAVQFLLDEYRRLLAAGRPARLETAKQMLECRATALQ